MEAIKIERLSKAYQLGQFNTGTLSHDLKRWWALKRGKSDPFLKIGETNDRTKKGTSNIVWSLRDVSLSIDQGDTVGIIGRNGAGKSTLLKILSQVTSPTEGTISVRGKIASLLEVGTGFHPELSGRENIYLNGAILGMRKSEIARKFDEIVAFSGVERYIDTPVKRYSSGMYVRLAFAVAAHLESEILIVDEVLAVGDVEFQKKCLGKMDDISKGEGRTILFVSHNLPMIGSLCKKGIVLQNGQLVYQGNSSTAISKYQNGDGSASGHVSYEETGKIPGDSRAQLLEAYIKSVSSGLIKNEFDIGEVIQIAMRFRVLAASSKPFLPNFHFFDQFGQYVFISSPAADKAIGRGEAGEYTAVCNIPAYFFNSGNFSVGLALTFFDSGIHVSFFDQNALNFTFTEDFATSPFRNDNYGGEIPGPVRPLLQWNLYKN